MSVAEPSIPAQAKILANIMVGSNQATSAAGRSSPLRTPEDGIRFHQVRASAKALIIGGNTFRNEPYQKAPLPVFVASANLTPIQDEKLYVANLSPRELIAVALKKVGAPVLIEGGVNFLQPLIQDKSIEALLITRTPKSGDGNFWDDVLLEKNYELTSHENASGSKFEIWRPKA
jgi:dihydrofolate reductase